MINNLFQGLNDADPSANHPPKIAVGFDGDLQVLKTELQNTRYGLTLFAQHKVVTSNHPEHPVGSICTWSLNFTSHREVKMRNLMSWLVALCGMKPDDPQVEGIKAQAEQIMANATQSPTQNQLVGRTAHCKGRLHTNKERTKQTPVQDWSPATGQAGPTVVAQPAPQFTPAPTAGPGNMPGFPTQPTAVQGAPQMPQLPTQLLQPQVQAALGVQAPATGQVAPPSLPNLTPPAVLPPQK